MLDVLLEAGALGPLASVGLPFDRNPWCIRNGARGGAVAAVSLLTLGAICWALWICTGVDRGFGSILAGSVLTGILSIISLTRRSRPSASVGGIVLFVIDRALGNG
jgi:hypothetical protein